MQNNVNTAKGKSLSIQEQPRKPEPQLTAVIDGFGNDWLQHDGESAVAVRKISNEHQPDNRQVNRLGFTLSFGSDALSVFLCGNQRSFLHHNVFTVFHSPLTCMTFTFKNLPRSKLICNFMELQITQTSCIASPKFFWGSKMTVSEHQYFVCDTASQRTKYARNFKRACPSFSPPGYTHAQHPSQA